MWTEPSHCRCQVMCARHCTYSRTSWEEARSTHPIPVPQSSMDRRCNMRTLWTQQSIYQINKLTLFNMCEALSYIMPLPSITLFSLPSETFPQSNKKPQQTLQKRWLSSWTISHQIHKRKSNTEQVGCNWTSIETPPTFQSLKPEAGPVESIFSPKAHLTPKIQNILCRLPTASYLLCAKSCTISWRQQPKPNTAPSLSTPKQWYPSTPPSLNWDGIRYPHPTKWKIPLR